MLAISVRAIIPAAIREYLMAARGGATIRKNQTIALLAKKGFLFPVLSDQEHINLILNWLEWATTKSSDGGIPQMVNVRRYAEDGRVTLAPSYPETTGYILCTLIFGARHGLKSLPRKKLDQIKSDLLSVQREDGAMPGPGDEIRGLAFDTGQVLTGLVAYHRHVEALAESPPRLSEPLIG